MIQGLSLHGISIFVLLQMEYLPVYYPSEEEKADPDLFGRNVRAVMAAKLKVPVMDVSFNSYVKEHSAK